MFFMLIIKQVNKSVTFLNSTLVLTHVTCMLPKIHVEFAICAC